jgi:hypothetical protein
MEEGKGREEPFKRPRLRWYDHIRMYLREIGWEGVEWMHLARNRDQWRALVNTVMYVLVQ